MLLTRLLGESFLPLGLRGVVVGGPPHPCSSSCSGHRGSLTPSRTGRRNQKMRVLPPPQVSWDARPVLAPLGTSGPHHDRLTGCAPCRTAGQVKAAWPDLRVCCLGLLHRGFTQALRVCPGLQGGQSCPLLPLNWLPWAWPVLRLAEGHSGKGCYQPTMPES